MITESLRESILSEYQKASQASYAVSALLNSASINCRSRWEILHDILEQSENYVVYKFNIRYKCSVPSLILLCSVYIYGILSAMFPIYRNLRIAVIIWFEPISEFFFI